MGLMFNKEKHMSNKQNDEFYEHQMENDIRYRATCIVCKKSLGDWALKAAPEKQRCYQHKLWNFNKEGKLYAQK